MAITQQQIVRDFTQLLKTRGARLAGLGGLKASSDYYKVYSVAVGAATNTTPSGTLRLVIDFDQTVLDALGEIASGAEDSVIPKPDRV